MNSTPLTMSNEDTNILLDFMEEWQSSEVAVDFHQDSASPRNNIIMIDQQPTANDNEVERQEANEKPSSAKKARNRKNRVNKKSTKKSKISAADQPPKRPLLAYNIYFQYERQRILDEVDHLPPSDVNAYLVMKIANDYKARPRRKHRKSHGKISFLNLSKTIAHRWKMLDRFVKQHFEKQGKIEAYLYQQRYSQRLQEQENKKNPNHDGSEDGDDDDNSSENGGDSLISNEQEEQQHVKKKEPPISNTASYPDVELSIESTSKQNLKTGGVHIIMDNGLEKPMELEEFPSQTTIQFCPLLAKAKHDGYNLFEDVAGVKPSDFF